MGVLSKVKSKLKSVVNTAKSKIVNAAKTTVAKTSGGGAGGGGGGSWSAPKINNAASVVQAKPNMSVAPKITIPKSPSGGQSKVPVNQSVVPKTTDPLSRYTPGAAYSYTPSPTSKKNESVNQLLNTISDLKTGKTKGSAPKGGGLPPYTVSELEKRGYVTKTGDNTYKSTGVYEASAPSNKTASSSTEIDADFLSLASDEYSYGLGDLGLGESAVSSFSAPSSSSSSSTSSTSKTGGGGASSTAPTSSRGVDSASARDQALARAKSELERIQREVGNLTSKDESVAQDAVSSDTPEVQEEDAALNQLKDVDLSPSTKALRLLDSEIKRNEQNLKDELSTIGGDFNVRKTGVEGEQAGEVGQTSMAIANAGGYLGFTGSGQGVMLSLAESHRAELTALESERQQALQEARNAAANRRFDIVRLKAAEIARIDQETYERTKEYNAEVKKEADKQKEDAKTRKTQSDVLTAIQGGAKTPEAIFKKLKGTVSLDEINDVLDAVAPSGDGLFKPTPTQTSTMLGAGMSAADIATFNEYVNENGYTEEIRQALTPAQRTAIDKFMRPKDTSSSSTTDIAGPAISLDEYIALAEDELMMSIDPNSDIYQNLVAEWKAKYPVQSNIKFTRDQLLKLEQGGLLGASRQEQLDYLYAPKDEDLTWE